MSALASPATPRSPVTTVPRRIAAVRRAARDCVTLDIEHEGAAAFGPGQFNMLYVFGVGEVAISVSSHASEAPMLSHTIRSAGTVTGALCAMRPGDTVGVRGPYGNQWPLTTARGRDLVLVAGGIGLAPLRPVVLHALAHRDHYRRVVLLLGARTPADLLYDDELEAWRDDDRIELRVTVDVADRGWSGPVGVVTRQVERTELDPTLSTVVTCGPPVMMRFVARSVLARGIPASDLYVSLERNMRCGVGTCGHCQLGTEVVCRDGPVFTWPEVARLLEVREL
jgi:NAD(P)H-flavin reductase